MATTTPRPVEDSPEHREMAEPSERELLQAGPPESTPGTSTSSLDEQHAWHEAQPAPRWTLLRTLKIAIYIILTIIVTFTLLVLMHGTAFTADSVASASTGKSSGVQDWIQSGIEAWRKENGKQRMPSTETPVVSTVALPPANDSQARDSTLTKAEKIPTPRPEPLPSGSPTPASPPSMGERDDGSNVRRTARKLPPLRLRRISEIDDESLSWFETLDLVLSLEVEFKDQLPRVEPRVLRASLYHHLIELSVRIGHSDNPRENLEAIRGFMAADLALVAMDRDVYPLDMIRTSTVLSSHRGSPQGVALIGLILADRLNPYLQLEPIQVGGVLGLRYRSGSHRYTLVPRDLSRIYSDRQLVEFAFGSSSTPKDPIQVLSRRQFWGTILCDTGAALIQSGSMTRASGFVDRGLALFPGQARGHVARSRILLDNNDLEGSLEELDLAVSLDPENTAGRMARVQLLTTMGDPDVTEQDLIWLARNGTDPDSGLNLARHLLTRSRYSEALEEVQRLESRSSLPEGVGARVTQLRTQILAGPWVAVLSDAKKPPRYRFEAIERLQEFRLPEVFQALTATLDDRNLRLARLAWKNLVTMTGWELPFDSIPWKKAFERRKALDAAAR